MRDNENDEIGLLHRKRRAVLVIMEVAEDDDLAIRAGLFLHCENIGRSR